MQFTNITGFYPVSIWSSNRNLNCPWRRGGFSTEDWLAYNPQGKGIEDVLRWVLSASPGGGFARVASRLLLNSPSRGVRWMAKLRGSALPVREPVAVTGNKVIEEVAYKSRYDNESVQQPPSPAEIPQNIQYGCWPFQVSAISMIDYRVKIILFKPCWLQNVSAHLRLQGYEVELPVATMTGYEPHLAVAQGTFAVI